jgi:hypothetical protein
MTYEVRTISEIDNKNIKLGKTFKYSLGNDSNYNLTNIYYVNPNANSTILLLKESESKKQDSIDDKTKLIIQTPLMYIPNSMIYFNDKPFLELSFNNEDNDKDVSEFKLWISNLEEYIYKLIKKRTSLGIEKSNMCSILKGGNGNGRANKLIVPINMNISKCILNDDCNNKKSKILFNWEIPVPTYAISIIWIKNIWIKKGKWGINLFMYASRAMNSHMLDPIEFMDLDSNNKTIKSQDIIKQFKDDKNSNIQISQIPEYTMFFKMLKMGIPKDAVKQKMHLLNLDTRYIDYPDTTPYVTVMHYISNPNLGSYVKPKNETENNSGSGSMGGMGGMGGIGMSQGLLNNIVSSVKLKKVDTSLIPKLDLKDKILKNNNINNRLKVPTLNDIQGALSRLKKLNVDVDIDVDVVLEENNDVDNDIISI